MSGQGKISEKKKKQFVEYLLKKMCAFIEKRVFSGGTAGSIQVCLKQKNCVYHSKTLYEINLVLQALLSVSYEKKNWGWELEFFCHKLYYFKRIMNAYSHPPKCDQILQILSSHLPY